LEDPPEAALKGLAFAACANPREEAQVAALRMRFELETPERTVALVTRDRDLARRVAADLRRWSIEVDDSAGKPLGTTPAGAFFRLVASALGANWAPVPLLALLKHPFMRLGRQPGDVRSLVRRLELLALRGPRPGPGIDGLRHALADRQIDHELEALLSDLETATAELDALMRTQKAPLAQLITHHAQTLESLAKPEPDATQSIWDNEDGEALHNFVSELLGDADALGFVDTGAYPALLDTLLTGRVVRPRYGSHPRAFIWGPLEARMQHADCVILGGLVEGNWPPDPPSDPWMSRPMRARFGLATPEQRIGLAAHDFVQAAMARSTLLLYPERAAGAPTVPARWLVRLQAFLDARNMGDLPRTDATLWQRWQSTIDRPSNVEPAIAPEPRPPLDVRPDRLSVTQVEVWQRDPYAIYARRILGLSPLEDLDEDADAANRGSFIHDALERFVTANPITLPPDALEQLLAMGRDVLGTMIERPSVATFWWRRFERIAAWFIEEEQRRRENLRAVHAETTACLSLPHGPRGSFTLSAKADRLEVDLDGRVAVIDYKTGTVPPGKAVEAGAAPQLPLEAALVAAGAYPGIPETDVSGLEYWELKGGEPAAYVKRIKANPSEVGERALEGLGRLVTAFSDENTPYRDHPAGEPIGRFDTFVDIARTNEWRLGWQSMLDDVAYGGVPKGVTHQARTQNDRQQAMSDPHQTVWVAASAGTGKTKVLTDRVLRLMLSGSEPSRILCLTFTRAASAEMANRIRQELAGWVSMTKEDLVADLTALQGKAPDSDEILRARQLFANVLDAPGGLQIATIHSFCQSVLGRFPLEAGVAPHFSLIEERGRSELLSEARDRVIGQIAAGRAPELEEPLNRLIVLAGESRAGELLDEISAASGRLDLMLEQYGSLERALQELAEGLQVDPERSSEELLREACLDSAFDRDGLGQAGAGLAEGSKTDKAKSDAITRFLTSGESDRIALFDDYCSVFLKADKRPGT
ncbi:MAG: double-strand break repair protein AddB, partial [Alphaproteobacteria bacterium]